MVEIGNRLRGMTKKEFEQLPAPKAEEWDPLNDDCWIRLVNEDTGYLINQFVHTHLHMYARAHTHTFSSSHIASV